MLLLHRAESSKAGHVLPWASGTNRRKLLIHIVTPQIPGVHGELALQCECPADLSKGHIFLANSKRNDNKKQQSKALKLKVIYQLSQTVALFISWREYIIFQNIIYIHIFQMVQSNYRSILEDSCSFFIIPIIFMEKNPFSFSFLLEPTFHGVGQSSRSSRYRILHDTQ